MNPCKALKCSIQLSIISNFGLHFLIIKGILCVSIGNKVTMQPVSFFVFSSVILTLYLSFFCVSLHTVYIFQFRTTIISLHVKLDPTNSYVTSVSDMRIQYTVYCIRYTDSVYFTWIIPDCENESNFYEQNQFQLEGNYDSRTYLMIGAKPSYKVRR